MKQVERIQGHLEKLSDIRTRRRFRLMHWRLIIRLAQEGYDEEIQQLDSLNSVKADAALEVPIV